MYQIIKTSEGYMVQTPDGGYLSDAKGDNCFSHSHEAQLLAKDAKISTLLAALDVALEYIETISGGDANESPTYLHLLKVLREEGEA